LVLNIKINLQYSAHLVSLILTPCCWRWNVLSC